MRADERPGTCRLCGRPTACLASRGQTAGECRVRALLPSPRRLAHGSRATGVTTEVVERMESNFKRDVLKELRASGGRVLLHDEVEERPGVFAIIPIWQEVQEKDIMTPRNVFELMAKEGYRVSSRCSESYFQPVR